MGACEPLVLHLQRAYPVWSETFVRRDLSHLQDCGLPMLRVALFGGDCQAELGWPEVSYLACGSSRPIIAPEVAAGSRPQLAAAPRRPPSIPRLLRAGFRALSPGLRTRLCRLRHRTLLEALCNTIAVNPVSHLHAEFADLPAVLAAEAARRLSISYSVGAHAHGVFAGRFDARQMFGRARFVTVCNQAAARHLTETAAVDRDRLHLIPHGIDLEHWRFETSRPAPGRPLRLLFVGRLVEKKGVALLLEAMRLLADSGEGAGLTVVGSGPEGGRLRTRAAEIGIAAAVTWAGVLPAHGVREQMTRADCLAAPSVVARDGDRDGIPNVVMEAMALGTPVTASNVGGLAEVVSEETAWPVKPDDAVDLARALREIPLAPGRCEEKRRKARIVMETEFNARDLGLRRYRLLEEARTSS